MITLCNKKSTSWPVAVVMVVAAAILMKSIAFTKREVKQHRRLAAADDKPNKMKSPTSLQRQTSTVISAITSKFNEKRSFLDPSWKDWGDALIQFETLVSPAELDFTTSRRLPWEEQDEKSSDKCDEILLLMPEYFARNGHGSQLNSYLLAAMMATFLGKAMLILDAPQSYSKYPNGSMVSKNICTRVESQQAQHRMRVTFFIF